ncbi:MAG: MarR family transcriptional regulator [Candidatus Rehaiarchaeum fermentans]|nr:transcriptional regulator [Candidatus Rehaiarchaeum fermentans]
MEEGKISRFLFKRKPFLVLKHLSVEDNIYAAQMAKKINCSYAYIIRLLKDMEKLGLIYIEKNRSTRIIKLTKKGRNICEKISEIERLG